MGATKQDINDFRARVKRINNPRNNSYYDPDLEMHIPKRVGRDKIKKASRSEDESLLGPFLVSMILGAVALMFAQVIRVRYFGLMEPSQVVFYIEMFLTFWALLMLGALLQRRSIGARFAQLTGVGVMMIAGHNIIWRWPDQMAFLYTSDYVDQVMTVTTQHSVVFRGAVFGP